MRYPEAKWVPWGYGPLPTYYDNMNHPEAAILHIAVGWKSTIASWAAHAHFGASWHFTVCQDGAVWQHLDFEDGGYHAGIEDSQAAAYPPRWALWKGPGRNINHYTIGIEHEGFPGDRMPTAQESASRKLCRWLAKTMNWPLDYAHFTPHADIDLINRRTDFNNPVLRTDYYSRLLWEEDDMGMTDAEKAAMGQLMLEHQIFEEVIFGTKGPAEEAQRIANERIKTRIEGMRAGTMDSLAEDIQQHFESPHGGGGNPEEGPVEVVITGTMERKDAG